MMSPPDAEDPTMAFSSTVNRTTSPPGETNTTTPSSGANNTDQARLKRSKEQNAWIRDNIYEPAAEFLGVMILVMFGNGAACQTQLSRDTNVTPMAYGDYLSVNLGFAVGLALGGWVAGFTSKGHINPAVTIAMAIFRRDKKFTWRKVAAYIFAQVMGGLCGAGIIYANYIHAIDLVEGGRHIRTVPGTASLFATYALPYMTSGSAWFEEFLGTAMLLIAVCAMCNAPSTIPKVPDHSRSTPDHPQPPTRPERPATVPGEQPARGQEQSAPAAAPDPEQPVADALRILLTPLVLFITMLGISASLGMQTGFAINPARDLGPRLLTAMVGYGAPVFTFRNQYWLWCPILAPIVGGLVGVVIYDILFYTGEESIVRNWITEQPATNLNGTATS